MKNFKPKFKIVDRVRASKNDSPFRKRYKPQLKGLQALFYQINCQLAVGLIKFQKYHQYQQTIQEYILSKNSKNKKLLTNFIKKS